MISWFIFRTLIWKISGWTTNKYNRSVYVELYSIKLDQAHDTLDLEYNAFINRKPVIVYQDPTIQHTNRRTNQLSLEIVSIEFISHQAYILISTFFIRWYIVCNGRAFANLDEVENGCCKFFVFPDKPWYGRRIKQLAEEFVRTRSVFFRRIIFLRYKFIHNYTFFYKNAPRIMNHLSRSITYHLKSSRLFMTLW